MASQCRKTEEKGFPVNGRTISVFSPFADAPAGTPWLETMLHYYTVFSENGRAKWLILALPEGRAVAISVVSGEVVCQYALDSEGPGVFSMFHRLQDQGMRSCGYRLDQYETFVACMDEAGITPESVHRALNADISSLLLKQAA